MRCLLQRGVRIAHGERPLPCRKHLQIVEIIAEYRRLGRSDAKHALQRFDAHARAFAALGGIPRRGIYDNMKTAVDKVKKGKARVVNTRFAAMAAHYLFDPEFCNVASGWEKGVVEKNVQDSRRRLWQDAAGQRFGSFTELNLWLLARCRALWRELKHPEYDLTLAEMLEQEQPHLMPMVTPFDGYVETLGKVSSTCLVSEERNRYSAPCELVGQMVSIRIYPERIDLVAHDFF